MATTSTSGLSTNNDFSAELILNRLQNGSLKANSGKTVTAAGRTNAAALDLEARTLGNQAGEIAKGLTYAQGVQNSLSEVLAQVKKIGDAIASKTLNSDTGTVFKANLDALKTEVVDGKEVFSVGGVVVDLDDTAKISLGSDIFNNSNFSAFFGSIANGKATESEYNKAVAALNEAIMTAGAQYDVVANRYDSVNDLIGTYQTASNDQAVAAGGSASSLLDSVL